MTTTKPRSSCCDAPAKIDRTGDGLTYFCSKCVKTCTLKSDPPKFNGLSTKRVPSGERAIMVDNYKAQNGLCAISKRPLLPPEHPQFHCQGSHILPKGTYPEKQCTPENIPMVLKIYHDQWEANKDKSKLVKIEPRWKPFVETYIRLFKEAQQHNRPWELQSQKSS